MGAALAIRDDLPPEAPRKRARRGPNRRAALRMLAIANALDGMSRAEAARLHQGGVLGMLGSAKRKARRAALGTVQAHLRILNASGGVPFGFWGDKFVLGYFYCGMVTLARLATGGKMDDGELGDIIMGVLSENSGRDGFMLAKRILELQGANDQEYMLGVESSNKVIGYYYRLDSMEDDLILYVARKRAREASSFIPGLMGSFDEHGDIASVLVELLFYDVVRERFNAVWME